MNAVLAELLVLLPALWWPFCRYAAAISIAPFLGESVVPVRARLGLALALAVATLPAMRGLPPIDPFSLHGVVTAIEQAILGLLFGLAFQLVMTILSLLGFLVSSQMGLSMAVMNDPGNGSSSDVISNLLYLLAALLFFAMDGHLVLTQVVFDSFKVWPVGGGLLPQSLARLAASLGWVFAAAILLALPAVFATFVVQVGFGLINRVAPALNLFSLGFPVVTLFGLLTLGLVLHYLPQHYLRLSGQMLNLLQGMMGARGG